MTAQTFLHCSGSVFAELLPSNGKGILRHTRRTVILLRAFAASGTCLASRFLATIGGVDMQTRRLIRKGFMKYNVEMDVGFIKIGKGIQKLIKED